MILKFASSAIAIVLAATSCSRARNSGGGSGGNPPSGTATGTIPSTDPDGISDSSSGNKPTGGGQVGPVDKPAQPSLATVRNFEQYLYSLEAISGIKADTTAVPPPPGAPPGAPSHTVNSVYMGNKDNLPGSNKVKETAPVNVKAYADLAAVFGRRLFMGTDTTQQRIDFLGADVTVAPDQYFTDENLSLLIKKAWGGSVDSATLASAVSILRSTVMDLKTNLRAGEESSADGTKKLLVAAWSILIAADMVQ